MTIIDMFRFNTRNTPEVGSGYYCVVLDDTLYFKEGLGKKCESISGLVGR